MKKILLLSIILLLGTSACSRSSSNTSDKKEFPTLNGSYISTDDPKASIDFTKGHLIMNYEGASPTDSDVYSLSFTDSVTENGRIFNNGNYLTLTNTDETLHYEILEWTSDKVSLIYLSRGNTLTWVKSQKQQSQSTPQKAIEE